MSSRVIDFQGQPLDVLYDWDSVERQPIPMEARDAEGVDVLPQLDEESLFEVLLADLERDAEMAEYDQWKDGQR